MEPGPIKDENGKLIGQHKGIAFYTIGQRSGLGIGAGHRLYVTSINVSDRAVYVGDGSTLHHRQMRAEDVNWISVETPLDKIRVRAKIRYRQKEADAWVFPNGSSDVKIIFDNPQRAPAPGQAVVFYQDDLVVGGGTLL